MNADLGDLLPEKVRNAHRITTDAELITLSVAQAIMDIPFDEALFAVARKRLKHLFPRLPKRPGYQSAGYASQIGWSS